MHLRHDLRRRPLLALAAPGKVKIVNYTANLKGECARGRQIGRDENAIGKSPLLLLPLHEMHPVTLHCRTLLFRARAWAALPVWEAILRFLHYTQYELYGTPYMGHML